MDCQPMDRVRGALGENCCGEVPLGYTKTHELCQDRGMEEGELSADEAVRLDEPAITSPAITACKTRMPDIVVRAGTKPYDVCAMKGVLRESVGHRARVPAASSAAKNEFRLEEKVGEGTFGVVHKAVHKKTGRSVALKKILLRPEQEGFPITALREIKLLKLVQHPNIMSIINIAVTPTNDVENSGVYMVFPFMDHDLTGLLESPEIEFTLPQIKCYMKQLLCGLDYLHRVNILHRDIKGANLLINNQGELKITDFGLARPIEENRVHYTPGVVTRWYRPPEVLLGSTRYGRSIDMWGVGCILGEMLTKKPLLPGDSDIHQLELVTRLCGSINEDSMPGCSQLPDWPKLKLPTCRRRILESFSPFDPLAADLIDRLLCLDPEKRLTARQALDQQFFKAHPPIALPGDLPIYPSRHEFTAAALRQNRNQQQEPPRPHPPHPTPRMHGVEEKTPADHFPSEPHPKRDYPVMNAHPRRSIPKSPPQPDVLPRTPPEHYPPQPVDSHQSRAPYYHHRYIAHERFPTHDTYYRHYDDVEPPEARRYDYYRRPSADLGHDRKRDYYHYGEQYDDYYHQDHARYSRYDHYPTHTQGHYVATHDSYKRIDDVRPPSPPRGRRRLDYSDLYIEPSSKSKSPSKNQTSPRRHSKHQ